MDLIKSGVDGSSTRAPVPNVLATSSTPTFGNEEGSSRRRRCWDEAFASDSEEEYTVESSSQSEMVTEMEDSELCSSGTEGDKPIEEEKRIICEAHPSCMKTFTSTREYEDHYQLRHMHKCVTCRKSLPSAHILELHVLEAHDTLFSLMAEKKPMLACFLETCSTKFWKAEERKEHCLSEHKFPKTFYLWNLSGFKCQDKKSGGKGNKGKEKRKGKGSPSSKVEDFNQHETSSSAVVSSTSVPVDKMEVENGSLHNGADQLKNTQKPSKSQPKGRAKASPAPITFGHSASRTFKVKYTFGLAKASSSTPDSQMELDMSDIKEVLPATNAGSEAHNATN